MTTQKKRTTVWIDPPVLRKLKIMGAIRDQPIGNVIEALVDFTESAQYVKDPEYQRRFAAFLDMAFANAGQRGGFVGDPPGSDFEAGQGPNGDDVEEG